jgi:hypothetical protein
VTRVLLRSSRPTILLDEELARAVRREAAAAIQHWWCVGVTLVWRWRRCLGVGRMDSEGSRRLILAAVEAGADVTRGVPLSEGECERRSRTNREKDLKRHLHPGYHGPRWTPQELAMLGTLPDRRGGGADREDSGCGAGDAHAAGHPQPGGQPLDGRGHRAAGHDARQGSCQAGGSVARRRHAEAVPAGDRQPVRPQTPPKFLTPHFIICTLVHW